MERCEAGDCGLRHLWVPGSFEHCGSRGSWASKCPRKGMLVDLKIRTLQMSAREMWDLALLRA